MRALELKVPPLAVALVAAVAMWIAARATPAFVFLLPARVPVAAGVALAGAAFAALGARAFRRAGTTLNPMKPQAVSRIVSQGAFALSRNPMYVGMLLALVGWAILLGGVLPWLGPPAFVAYMTRFQIVPEERALAARFGPEFDAYAKRVRRWL
ncbi:MAG: isoprenylcysteine carboxylmethyltransferase family protein [Burkholderiaceae bacterium]